MRIIFTLCLTLCLSVSLLYADDATAIMNDYKNEKKADYVNLPRFLVRMGMRSAGQKDLAKRISAIKMLDLDECSQTVKEGYARRLSALPSQGYEVLMRMKDGDDRVFFLIKEQQNMVVELLIGSSGDSNSLALFSGEFQLEELAGMIQMDNSSEGCSTEEKN